MSAPDPAILSLLALPVRYNPYCKYVTSPYCPSAIYQNISALYISPCTTRLALLVWYVRQILVVNMSPHLTVRLLFTKCYQPCTLAIAPPHPAFLVQYCQANPYCKYFTFCPLFNKCYQPCTLALVPPHLPFSGISGPSLLEIFHLTSPSAHCLPNAISLVYQSMHHHDYLFGPVCQDNCYCKFVISHLFLLAVYSLLSAWCVCSSLSKATSLVCLLKDCHFCSSGSTISNITIYWPSWDTDNSGRSWHVITCWCIWLTSPRPAINIMQVSTVGGLPSFSLFWFWLLTCLPGMP